MTEKYKSPCSEPVAYDRELLVIMVEECSEIMKECMDIQQRATKLLRFGSHEVQAGQFHDNSYRLGMEIGDLQQILEMAEARGLFTEDAVMAGRIRKKKQLVKFLQNENPDGR